MGRPRHATEEPLLVNRVATVRNREETMESFLSGNIVADKVV
jgi:hypothetical protein